jgi:predicted MFS family arabinose efflux permease
MPTGTALALLAGPWVIGALGWQALWGALAVAAGAMAAWVMFSVPADNQATAAPLTPHATSHTDSAWPERLRLTLSTPGPWLVALAFAMYSSQWLAVIGFLPSVYAQAGLAGPWVGVMTALVCAANIVGNVGAGHLLHRGLTTRQLLHAGFVSMAVAAFLAFNPLTEGLPVLRYVAVVLFSAMGGLVPGTLFSLAVRVAPSERTVSTTVGWMQQCSSTGQFLGPPLVAWVAAQTGGWHWTWLVTGAASLVGLLLVRALPDHTAA